MFFFQQKIILASQSPRRKELMQMTGIPFEIRVADVDESFVPREETEKIPEQIASRKAGAVWRGVDEIIIGADTMVFCEGNILGKPKDEQDAKRMLQKLSGREHKVISGVCLRSKDRELCFGETTTVKFCNLSEREIDFYIENYRPLDKAGAYAIQEWIGAIGIEYIQGCYYNVVGLPLQAVVKALQTFEK